MARTYHSGSGVIGANFSRDYRLYTHADPPVLVLGRALHCTSQERDKDMLGNALRCIRIFHDLKQSEAATQLGISRSYLSEIESETKQPTLQLLKKYSEVFDIPISSILFFSENIDQPGVRKDARQFVASKILALMKFLEKRAEDTNHAK